MKQSEIRPLLIRTAGTTTFFDGAKRGELMLQHCQKCGQYNLSGYHFCPVCLSTIEWCHSDGSGQINSFSIVYESSHPGFKELLPYAVAEVTLSEGPILSLRVAGAEPGEVTTGQQVKVEFLDDERGESVPVWKVVR